jgi:NAD(P)-dependent dehydrogenase (short-subunit alcohol dehydrogenase family)
MCNKVAVVTGGTRGIGLATVKELVATGYSVIAVGVSSNPVLPEHCEFRQVDFQDLNQLKAFASELKRISPDVLINNVGIERNGPLVDVTLEQFQTVMQVNLTSCFLLSQAVIPGMKERGTGRIVNVTSVWGKVSRSHRAAYSASKFAIEGLSISMADEMAPFGVTINCVAPGFIDIDATGKPGRGQERNHHLASHVPMRRMGKVTEVAATIAWLASDSASFITGQSLAVDGGFVSSGSRSSTF